MPTVIERVCRVMAETQSVPIEAVQPDTSFEKLGIDWLVKTIVRIPLEREFGPDMRTTKLPIPTDDFDDFSTPQDVADYLLELYKIGEDESDSG